MIVSEIHAFCISYSFYQALQITQNWADSAMDWLSRTKMQVSDASKEVFIHLGVKDVLLSIGIVCTSTFSRDAGFDCIILLLDPRGDPA